MLIFTSIESSTPSWKSGAAKKKPAAVVDLDKLLVNSDVAVNSSGSDLMVRVHRGEGVSARGCDCMPYLLHT